MNGGLDRSRAFVKDVKRLVVKVGTAVATRSDGRLALGRLGALCEQIKELNSEGYEVILVSSGAVGIGRQRLRYRKLVNSSFADLQKPQVEIDGKACAAVGQNSLMALYDTLFGQLDVTSAQLLVTDNDFRDKEFRKQLNETVKTLLSLRVIPIFNENDAVSTRRAPYEDSSGIFWDNDSLSALLALELKADLLILLSDVEGLYSGPPSDPRSKLIHTYIKEKHQGEITFGDKSRVGRGGMTAKVKAAVNAAYAGVPVVITSGYAPENIIKVLQGECVGTLFHQHAHLWAPVTDYGARVMAVAARESSRRLQALTSQDRRKILLDIADALEANEKLINIENEADVTAAQLAGLEKSLISRLALKPGKIKSLANSIRVLANMEDPIGHVLKRTELADGLLLEKTSSPLGVLLIIFESRPDALVQISSLAIRSGNALLLKGGKEAKRSNEILHKVITSAIPESVGGRLIGLVTSREEIPDLLKLDDVIDLVIPRGSNKLVSQIKASTKIPVLGHAGNPSCAQGFGADWCLNELTVDLRTAGVNLYGGPRASKELNLPEAHSFHHEYNSMTCTIEIVDDVYAAIDHIHQHGSAHTDCIIAEDHEVAEVFLRQVDSAAVFHNASTRFCDGARFGLGAEVGISTSRIHARGPVGVEGLLTTRWILRGSGQVVDGDNGVMYTHKDVTHIQANGFIPPSLHKEENGGIGIH
ncbi:hypothetical protein GH714_036270 [Hevea brasiliensis]|uniref:Delta-1-pyrroline-5-carboxylate synthase n=1 Tax=Hevea brasiliensis TaxID=3981 RepID=A0A6A6L7T2_HEVBR|nr:hypothetical protein GH714_036270 [Hevea brasiliensis]